MLANSKRIVIKVGSSLIAGEDNHERGQWLATLVSDIATFKRAGKEIIVVTSGAVAFGRCALGYGARKLTLEEKQAAAACGQISLFALWAEKLAAPSVHLYPAQLLLTADDSIHRRRYLNVRNTLEVLLENKTVVPVINENDTVATAELRFGDNDRLAARVAQMAGADLLVLFSDIDGLYTADPRYNAQAQFIEKVNEITAEIEAMAGGAASHVASGGMATKIAAARIATSAGCAMVIARGDGEHPLKTLLEGGKHTLFAATETPQSARKNWIAGSLHAAGGIVIDDGAVKALKSGKSLLPAGVVKVEGAFDRGDAVTVRDMNGVTLAKGLIAYSAEDARQIMGKQSSDIETILGYKRRDVLIHRDDMVLE